MTSPPAEPPHPVPFPAALRVWALVGLLGFGGPAGQIALMHRELVERRRWIDEPRFLHALSYCTLLPGPEAQQLAVYVGWLLHRTKGGIAAGTLLVLPGFVAVLGLSALYAAYQHVGPVAALFYGLKAAVLALVIEALVRIGRRALRNRALRAVAVASFVAIFAFDVPFPLIVLGAIVVGLVLQRVWPTALPTPVVRKAEDGAESTLDRMASRGELGHTSPSVRRAITTLVVSLLLWATPPVLLAALFGAGSVFVEQALFFSQTAVVTFGGAYAVRAYVAQRAVETYGWLRPGEMLDGLGLAETTPGPLILVLEFVAFVGAYRNPGSLPPMLAGAIGAAITTWVTFVPCFLWIFLGAPYIERLRASGSIHAALSAVTAAVVGVILNLSLWFGAHVIFGHVGEERLGPLRWLVPTWSTVDVAALVLAASALVAMLRFDLGLPRTLALCAAVGAAWKIVTS